MNWTVQCVEYYLYRGVSRTNAYEFMQQSGSRVRKRRHPCLDCLSITKYVLYMRWRAGLSVCQEI